MSSAVRQSSAQSYLQQNRIPSLFEELMAALIRDQPSEPLVHLMRTLHRKASERGIAVPVTLRPTLDDAVAASTAGPRPTASAGVSPVFKSSLSATAGAGRSYDKPWLRGSTVSISGGGAGSSVVKKSTSGGEFVAASVDKDANMFEDSHPLASGAAQRHRQPSRASLASTGGEAVFLWSSSAPPGGRLGGPSESSPVYATAALIAEAEAEILGRELRQARAPPAVAGADESGADAASVGGNKTAARRPTAGSRLAAKEARRKQLEVSLATSAASSSGRKANAVEAASGGPGGKLDGDEDSMDIDDGILLLEDSEALAAEGARVSGGRRAKLREVATTRQRGELLAGAAAAAAEPQVRMTFCGRCFAMINVEDEENGLTPLASARPDPRVGGFSVDGSARLGFQPAAANAVGDEVDDFHQLGPQTGRTMTEVTDIESASQVTGPRRPSWTTPAASGRSAGKSKRATAASREENIGGSSTTRSKGLESTASLSSQQRQSLQQQQQQQQQRPAASRGWGAAAEAADEFSDSETLTSATGNRQIQQDSRLY